MQKFEWWPTDAQPVSVKDEEKAGYWWWSQQPGSQRPWGNRGYVYVYKIIFAYKAEELPPAQPQELRPALLFKRIHKNMKVYFDYDSAELREDAKKILLDAVRTLAKNSKTDILITGNCDIRGSEAYNKRLGQERGLAVKNFILENGIAENRIRVVSRGKLAAVRDLVGMQKDRNAQFMIAEVEEVMLPVPDAADESGAQPIGEDKYLVEDQKQVESQIKVSERPYTIKESDSLWSIAQEQLGSIHRWKYLYEFNKDKIANPNKLKAETVISIPIERSQYYLPEDKPLAQEKSAPVLQPTPEKTNKTYTIKKGDSLWKIAQEQLGDGNRWKEIYNLNKDIIADPNKLSAGKTILIYP